ncbi:MAG: hypothetical protein OHK005_13820 [Candidatus Methylacidiphilales bacterium]
MPPIPHPDPSTSSGQITLTFSRRSLLIIAAVLALGVAPLVLGTVAVGGYCLWAYFDQHQRQVQAAAAHAETFSAEARSFESLLSAAELQKRDLDAALANASTASRANAIPIERLASEAETLRATTARLERGLHELHMIESRLRDAFRIRPADSLVSATHATTLRNFRQRWEELNLEVGKVPGRLAVISARRDELMAQAKAAERRALAQRHAAQQRANAQKATSVPRATVVREVIVARPTPVLTFRFGSFGPGYGYRHPFYRPVVGFPGYYPHRYSPCAPSGTRVGFGVSVTSR